MNKKMIITMTLLFLSLFIIFSIDIQNATTKVISPNNISKIKYNENIPPEWLDDGIFKEYYNSAYNKLMPMTLEEKIGQMLLVRYPEFNQTEILKKYKFAGYIFYAKDFENKTTAEVIEMTNNIQNISEIPLLTAVDEEGGKVVRISSNRSLTYEPFKSSSELYKLGGFEAIAADTIYKSYVLSTLGINLNLAPVVDVSTNSDDYIYERALQENTELTSTYAKMVIEASKGTGVSYTLKHFPGYGNNKDTHISISNDNRPYENILKNDLPPFVSGINAGAEAIMISHNIVDSIDSKNPASLSEKVNIFLRNDLNFTGIIMTDDLEMSALNDIIDVNIKAIIAGNDLIITTDYEKSFNEIKDAVNKGIIDENRINNSVFRILAWKYYKNLME